MGRYVGMLALLLGSLLLVNSTSDVLYTRALVLQEEEDEPAGVAATMPSRLPLTGLIQVPTGRWGQGRMIEASTKPMVQTAESCTLPVAAVQR